MRADPKIAIKLLNMTVFFALLRSARLKAARKHIDEIDTRGQIHQILCTKRKGSCAALHLVKKPSVCTNIISASKCVFPGARFVYCFRDLFAIGQTPCINKCFSSFARPHMSSLFHAKGFMHRFYLLTVCVCQKGNLRKSSL